MGYWVIGLLGDFIVKPGSAAQWRQSYLWSHFHFNSRLWNDRSGNTNLGGMGPVGGIRHVIGQCYIQPAEFPVQR